MLEKKLIYFWKWCRLWWSCSVNVIFACLYFTCGNLAKITPYRKPSKRQEPILKPTPTNADLQIDGEDCEKACTTEILYNILRSDKLQGVEDKDVPPWALFHTKTEDYICVQPVSNVIFNPILMALPTDLSTVYITLHRFKEACIAMGLSVIPTCFDMNILTKALEIIWTYTNELSEIIPVEGRMHFLMTLFAGFGYFYGDAGLRHLLQDSSVFATNT